MSSDLVLPACPDSISSAAFHPTDPNLLLIGSWDRHVYLHDLKAPGEIKKLPLRGPVLDVAWGSAQNVAYAGGLANEVRSLNFESNSTTLLTTHNGAVKCIEFCHELNAVISASWDSTMHITSLTAPETSLVISLPAKAYSMAVSKSKIVLAMGGRAVWIWEIKSLAAAMRKGSAGSEIEPWQKRESSLKFMTRAVRAMPNDEGYVTTSIEGRVAVEFFDPSTAVQSKKYAFKCHRQVVLGVDTVYPVQGLAFNPAYGTFATGGGDCTVSIWDPEAKKRLKQLPKYPSPISVLEFNSDGSKLAVAYSEGDEGDSTEKNGNGVTVRECGDECKPKSKA